MKFEEAIRTGYMFGSDSIVLGAGVLDSQVVQGLQVKIPLKTMNRHGLVAGATGTGKTKTLQRLTEQLSLRGVPVLIMDMKGDVSGISQPGEANEKSLDRAKKIGFEWKAEGFPVEFLTISDQKGVRMRATVSEFGPILFSKMLELNDTQQSVMALLFKLADDYSLPLLDLKDVKKLINFLMNEGKKLLTEDYGMISTATTGIILRKIIELEGQGAEKFFGEKSFDVNDLMRKDSNGKGYINILRLMDIQDQPKLFSTFMLSLISEIYHNFPEEGDVVKPKLVVFIDEAHLIFREATKTLLGELETVIKLIRSKGVGVYFCTQLPTDIPPVILSQLGMKVQFALRAFTATDRKAIRLVAQNYPDTEYYQTEELLTSLGIGEAMITVLNDRGNPTPLVHTLMAPPASRMDTISSEELNLLVANSQLVNKYSETIDSESAYEILTKKLGQAAENGEQKDVSNVGNDKSSGLGSVLTGLFGAGVGLSIARAASSSVINNVIGQITRGVLGGILGRK